MILGVDVDFDGDNVMFSMPDEKRGRVAMATLLMCIIAITVCRSFYRNMPRNIRVESSLNKDHLSREV